MEATPICGFKDSKGNFFETEEEAKCSSFAHAIYKAVNEDRFSNIYSGDVEIISKYLWKYYDILPKPLPSPIKDKKKLSWW
jgi:hypothetical protein